MGSLFDGVAGILSGAFGATVTHFGKDGTMTEVQSIFRKTPVEVQTDSGESILVTSPWWRVSQDALPVRPARGDQILAPDGKRYKIENVWPSGSAARDAFLLCGLGECK